MINDFFKTVRGHGIQSDNMHCGLADGLMRRPTTHSEEAVNFCRRTRIERVAAEEEEQQQSSWWPLVFMQVLSLHRDHDRPFDFSRGV